MPALSASSRPSKRMRAALAADADTVPTVTVGAVIDAASTLPSRALPAATAPAAPIEPASTMPAASTILARTAPAVVSESLLTAPSMRGPGRDPVRGLDRAPNPQRPSPPGRRLP